MIKSYISEKITRKLSKIHGEGLFAQEIIHSGEIVFIKGGHILKKSEIYTRDIINSYLPIDDLFYIGANNVNEEEAIKLYINHSCDPNCGIRGEITFVSLREIQPFEELTIDYATIDNENYSFNCNCRSNNCRKVVTGYDWKLKVLQLKYSEYFAKYLQIKISNIN